jgi:hypothetical protein
MSGCPRSSMIQSFEVARDDDDEKIVFAKS